MLVGGSAVTAHDQSLYVSRDADFVADAGNRELSSLMTSLNFSRSGFTWTYRSTEYTVQIRVRCGGDRLEKKTDFIELKKLHGTLKSLSLGDAVDDRLLNFIVWDDRDARSLALRLVRKYLHSLALDSVVQHLGVESPTSAMRRKWQAPKIIIQTPVRPLRS